MKRRLLAVLLACVIVTALLPASALAAGVTTGGKAGDTTIITGGGDKLTLSKPIVRTETITVRWDSDSTPFEATLYVLTEGTTFAWPSHGWADESVKYNGGFYETNIEYSRTDIEPGVPLYPFENVFSEGSDFVWAPWLLGYNDSRLFIQYTTDTYSVPSAGGSIEIDSELYYSFDQDIEGDGWSYDVRTATLTLSGVDLSDADYSRMTVELPDNATVYLADNTVNIIPRLSVFGTCRVTGNGTLKSPGSDTESVIYGDLIVESGEVEFNTAYDPATLTVHGGKLTLAHTKGLSYVTVTGGALEVNGTLDTYNLEISGGTVTVQQLQNCNGSSVENTVMSLTGGSLTVDAVDAAIKGFAFSVTSPAGEQGILADKQEILELLSGLGNAVGTDGEPLHFQVELLSELEISETESRKMYGATVVDADGNEVGYAQFLPAQISSGGSIVIDDVLYYSFDQDIQGNGWSYDVRTATLTLSGVDLSDTDYDEMFVELPDNATIYLADGTVNLIPRAVIDGSCRVVGNGALQIGSGSFQSSLIVESGNIDFQSGFVYGDLTVNGGTVQLDCTKALGQFTVTGGEVAINELDAYNFDIRGGAVTAQSLTNCNGRSVEDSSMSLTGGRLTVEGSTSLLFYVSKSSSADEAEAVLEMLNGLCSIVDENNNPLHFKVRLWFENAAFNTYKATVVDADGNEASYAQFLPVQSSSGGSISIDDVLYYSFDQDIQGDGWSYDVRTATLTLSGVDLSDADYDQISFELPDNVTVYLADDTVNIIPRLWGVFGTCHVTGNGTLKSSGYVFYGDLIVESGNIDFDGHLYVGQLTVHGGTVELSGTKAASKVTVTGGTVIIPHLSLYKLDISGGTVIAETLSNENGEMLENTQMSLTGGSLTVESLTSLIIYVPEDSDAGEAEILEMLSGLGSITGENGEPLHFQVVQTEGGFTGTRPYWATTVDADGKQVGYAQFLPSTGSVPSVTLGISNREPVVGETLSVTVDTSEDLGELTYAWYRGTIEEDGSRNFSLIEGANTATYVVTEDDIGYYLQCMVYSEEYNHMWGVGTWEPVAEPDDKEPDKPDHDDHRGDILWVIGGISTVSGPTKPTAPMGFTDVSTGDWFYDAVKYVYEEGLMNGTSDTKFSPSATLTRGMVVTILYRLEGKPATRYNARFSDVPDYQWYTDGVEWAVKNGIVNGYGNGKFGPEDPVTREQLTAILYRYAQYKNYGVTKTADLSAYTDSAKVSEYAVPAVKWAAANGILESTNGALRPTESATRAEVAAAVAAFHQKYVK